ncbi:EAL domain-containing protein [Butyrivibrio sp. XPD2006]|uniref:EAL domain-containing protein n=1 Tax=Butyrivibrio sp. XPD2006 TaxID=1280668 RepID=UPI0003B7B233|nr:EAL domain-containing protein [Butyrivibrio sp. XPD2006]
MPRVFSTRVFFAFLVVAYIHIVGDIIESAVFQYLDSSFYVLRSTSQSIYVGTLIMCAFIMALYVYAKISCGKPVSKAIVGLAAIPGIIGIVALLFGRINYNVNDAGQYYNNGFVVLLSYYIGFLYIFVTMVIAIMFRHRMRKDDALTIIAGLLIWAVLAFFQFSFHGYQVSSIAIMLMALMLFLSSENPREYYEKDIPGVKNKDAFDLVITERFANSKPFFITSVIFTGTTAILTGEDRHLLNRLQGNIAKMAEESIGEGSYLSSWNALSFIIENPEDVETLMSHVNNYKDDSGNYKLTYSVLEVPKQTKKADEALQILSYVSGEYVYARYSPNLVIDEKIIDKMFYRNSIEDVVRAAVKDKAFDVYYQPILNVAEGEFVSAEALVRLRRADNENFISPEDFIPVAERCGLIHEIDDLVFEKVCSFIAKENLSSYGIRKVEVNLSGNEVVDRKTYSRLIGKMEKYHIPPKFINFEITETAFINNDEAFKDNVQKLKEIGSTFSMDDFGSGYSNLLELLKTDYVMVKMDKEFIWNCLDPDKPENRRMLEYSIGFLKDFGLHVLAEGVETIEQAKTLTEKGVEYLQGFYYSRPLPENEYIEFLKAQKGDRR